MTQSLARNPKQKTTATKTAALTSESAAHAASPQAPSLPTDTMAEFRQEHDTMGVVNVPVHALYTAQTQRAVDNFPFGHPFTPRLITAMAQLKKACATANHELGLLDPDMEDAIHSAVDAIVGDYDKYKDQFPISIFQTGSGTSTNMNLNEVIATLATRKLEKKVHPNDHVNMSQSSNDVMPTTISVAAYLEASESLLPAMEHLVAVINNKAKTVERVVITGRTHLMDAMPVTLAQELGGWSSQISKNIARVKSALERVRLLAIGGTAVGTGINAHPEFGAKVCTILSSQLHAPFAQNDNLFEALSAPDSIVELSAQLKVLAVSLMKISNDLRWMNSGPIAGLGEIVLPALQPGSSIMPGKINPVIPESVTMVCAQVMGNDVTATVAGQSGSFQLNVMLPVLANSVLQSLHLLSHACRLLADQAIGGFTVNEERVSELVGKNPILVTALNPIVGYEMGAKIAKTAYKEGKSVKEVAMQFTDLSAEELDKHLDPLKLTSGGIADK
ncbi:Fumarate hydratase, mitochondrial, partial [Globisporangium splendens]